MKAKLKNFNQSARKVRLVAKMVRGKDVFKARLLLSFADQKSAPAILKLIDSALANAGLSRSDRKVQEALFIREIRVDEGMKLKRWRPRAFGRAARYRRSFSHITLLLGKK